MAQTMNVEQMNRWLKSLENPGKWGWMPEHKKIGKLLKTETGAQLKKHQGPDGKPWPKTYSKPLPKVGDRVPILIEGDGADRIFVQKLKTSAGRKRAVALRKKFGPPAKGLKPLIRTGKKRRATRIRDYLVRRATGRSLQMGKDFLKYGYTPGTKWIEELQFGGKYREGEIPKREILGLTKKVIQKIEEIYAAGMLKRIKKGLN